MNKSASMALALTLGLTLPGLGQAYPLDGYAETGIRRLEASRLAHEGAIKGGPRQPAGALLDMAQVDLRLLDAPSLDLPPVDPELSQRVTELLGSNADRYGIAVLDLSDPAKPRYAEHRGDHKQNVGSVGKLAVALALFQALADIWPDETDRIRVLKETVITADGFSHTDHHTVRIFDPETRNLVRRPIKDGDKATVWEYLDWMLSPSSNSAAGMLMRDAMLMRHYGADYPPDEAEIKRFFKETPKKELTALFEKTFFEPLTRNTSDRPASSPARARPTSPGPVEAMRRRAS